MDKTQALKYDICTFSVPSIAVSASLEVAVLSRRRHQSIVMGSVNALFYDLNVDADAT